jgi:KDO2-lipid IV(A) lauroyltransferase
MKVQKIIQSRFGVGLGLFIGRHIPTRLGYKLVYSSAKILATRRKLSIVQAVKQNQKIIRNEPTVKYELEKAARDVFAHAGRCFIDLYKNLDNPEKMKSMVAFDAAAEQLIEYSNDSSFGAFIVAPHLSNFDLCLLTMAYRGLKAQVLTYGQPSGGYQIQNRIRSETGLDITPVNDHTHKDAVSRMKEGGLVITAVDRPIRKKTHMLDFFNLPSPLPVGHIRMSLDAGVPIIVASASLKESGKYYIRLSEPIFLKKQNDVETELKMNGETVLREIEDHIRAYPGQWLMYYPVWPEVKVD